MAQVGFGGDLAEAAGDLGAQTCGMPNYHLRLAPGHPDRASSAQAIGDLGASEFSLALRRFPDSLVPRF